MNKLDKKTMQKISGGAFTWNGTVLNSFIRYVNVFFEIGQALGTAIRRKMSGSICKV